MLLKNYGAAILNGASGHALRDPFSCARCTAAVAARNRTPREISLLREIKNPGLSTWVPL